MSRANRQATWDGRISSPQGDYALLDFGAGRRLEKLGPWLLDRPAPQADQPPQRHHWQSDWVYDGARTTTGSWRNNNANAPEQWCIEVATQQMRLRLAGGGQIGLFPEHIACWHWLAALLRGRPAGTRMLNLFAASGGASLAAARAGAAVTHIDAQQSALSQAAANGSQLGLRIIREDVPRFVDRARRRGQVYPLIVLDPPSFGRGPKGQTWSLNRDLPALIETLSALLGPAPVGLWLSTHSNGWNSDTLADLLTNALPSARIQAGPLGVGSVDGRLLASGNAATAQW